MALEKEVTDALGDEDLDFSLDDMAEGLDDLDDDGMASRLATHSTSPAREFCAWFLARWLGRFHATPMQRDCDLFCLAFVPVQSQLWMMSSRRRLQLSWSERAEKGVRAVEMRRTLRSRI